MDEETEAERFNYVTSLMGFDVHELNAHYDYIIDEYEKNPDDQRVYELLVLVENLGKFLHGDDFIERVPETYINHQEKKITLGC